MNTAGSVAYGWVALTAAAGVAYYFAKQNIDARRQEQIERKVRPTEIKTWEDRVREYDQQRAAAANANQPASMTAVSGGTAASTSADETVGGTAATGNGS